MNKIYFTKLLPVEGEIKEDDKVVFDDPNKQVKGFKDWSGLAIVDVIKDHHYMIDLEHTTTDADIKNLKKVKLFLCSRDIQVGDEVFCPAMQRANEKVPDAAINPYFTVNTEEERQSAFDTKSIKVIGEISPDAVWLKEGMEFDQNELEFSLRWRKFPDESMYLDTIEQFQQWMKLNPNPVQYVPIIKIKCPTCNTFH